MERNRKARNWDEVGTRYIPPARRVAEADGHSREKRNNTSRRRSLLELEYASSAGSVRQHILIAVSYANKSIEDDEERVSAPARWVKIRDCLSGIAESEAGSKDWISEEYSIRAAGKEGDSIDEFAYRILVDFNELEVSPARLTFSENLSKIERRIIHREAQQLGFQSVSEGVGSARKISVLKGDLSNSRNTLLRSIKPSDWRLDWAAQIWKWIQEENHSSFQECGFNQVLELVAKDCLCEDEQIDTVVRERIATTTAFSRLLVACALNETEQAKELVNRNSGLMYMRSDTTGELPLHVACRCGSVDVVKVIMEANFRGGNFDRRSGLTAREMCEARGFTEICDLLESFQAS